MNKILLSLLFVCSSVHSYSQINNGIELGGNIMNADFVLQDPIETETSWGIRLGYVGELKFSDRLFARGAILINQRGFQFLNERWGLNAIDVPLNIGYSIGINNKSLRWFLDAGINLEYNFHAFTKVDGELVRLNIGSGEDDIRPFSQGFNIGTGLQLSDSVKLRINYYKGITNLLRSNGDNWKNEVIGISLNFFLKPSI